MMQSRAKYIGVRRKLLKGDAELNILKQMSIGVLCFLKSKKALMCLVLCFTLLFISINAGIIVPCYNVYYGRTFVGRVKKMDEVNSNFSVYPAFTVKNAFSDKNEISEKVLLCDDNFERSAALKINGETVFTAESDQIVLANIYKYLKNKGFENVEGVSFGGEVSVSYGVYNKKYRLSGEDALLALSKINPEIIDENGEIILETAENAEPDSSGFSVPVFASVSSPFGQRWGREHKGIDFAANHGDDVFSANDGVVSYSGYEETFGNLIIIDHGNGFESYYAHLSERLVLYGDTVLKGQTIGRVGNTGNSTGPHLHFEIRKDKKAINPAEFIGI